MTSTGSFGFNRNVKSFAAHKIYITCDAFSHAGVMPSETGNKEPRRTSNEDETTGGVIGKSGGYGSDG